LVDAFVAARDAGRSGRDGQLAEDDAGEQALSALYARGRVAYPELPVDDVAFAAHLGRCGAVVAPAADAAHLHAEDLYLCCAALLGNENAVRALGNNHHAVVAIYLRAADTPPALSDEVEQRLWDSVLIGSTDTPPKLASYSGRGSLASWIGVVAQRIALSLLRHEAAEKRALEGAAAEVRLAAADPELAFVKASLRDAFERALTDALLVLDDRQRMVYRLHIVDGLPVERIADMYGVVRSTVTRWLAAARAAVIEEAKRLLKDEMRVPAEDFDSLARLLASQLDLSISHILARPA
jgi:RNA polymerase sigma-70 factor (ECF subfamily)